MPVTISTAATISASMNQRTVPDMNNVPASASAPDPPQEPPCGPQRPYQNTLAQRRTAALLGFHALTKRQSGRQKDRRPHSFEENCGRRSSLNCRSRENYSPCVRSRIASSPVAAAKAAIAAAKLACGARRPRTGAARKNAETERPAVEAALSVVRVLAAACFVMLPFPAPERRL